jgi:hypothetical protein
MSGTPNLQGEFDEIISRLKSIQQSQDGGQNTDKHIPAPIPLIDPTANVNELVKGEVKRLNDLRTADLEWEKVLRELGEKWSDKLQTERQRADGEARKAEAGRIDSLLAENKNNVAIALAKQELQASAQEKRIAVLEQNQYQGVGAGTQRTENRQISQWVIGLIVGVAFSGLTALVTVLALFWKH